MLTLYHNNISVCAQKVRLVLAEKALAWENRHLNLRAGDQVKPEFLAINPKAVVPVIDHDGTIVTESTVILEYLDDAFPAVPLRPATPAGRARMRIWAKLPDDGIHIACATLSFACTFARQLRDHLGAEAFERRLAAMPDKTRAVRQRTLAEQGLEAPMVKDAALMHAKMFADMEKALAAGPFLAGAAYSLADAAILPYAERADRLGLAGYWADKPKVGAWFDLVRARPSFQTAIVAFPPNDFDDFIRLGAEPWPKIKALLTA